MSVDEELVKKIKREIDKAEAILNDCKIQRNEAIERDGERRWGTGSGCPPRPWAGFARDMDTGVSIPDCSTLEDVLEFLKAQLDQALRGELTSGSIPGFPDFPDIPPLPSEPVKDVEDQADSAVNDWGQQKKVCADFNKDIAIAYGGAAVACGLAAATSIPADVTIAGIPVTVALGHCVRASGALAWYHGWQAHLYSKPDPSRYDFHIVSKFKPHSFNLEPPRTDFEAASQDFAKQLAFLTIAQNALRESLERYYSLRDLRKMYYSADLRKKIRNYEIDQTEAIAHNAVACAQLIDGLLTLRPKMNSAWLQLREVLLTRITPDFSLTSQELSSKFAELWKTNMLSFQKNFNLTGIQMEEVMQVVDQMIKDQNFRSEIPNVLLDERWKEMMQATSAQLRRLSTLYRHLNMVLRESLGLPPAESSPETLEYRLQLSGVAIADEGAVTSGFNSGIRLKVAVWVPNRDAGSGWWGVVPPGWPAKLALSTKSGEAFLLPPGKYDVYWAQDYTRNDKPLLLAQGVEVKESELSVVHANSGIKLDVPAGTEPLDPYTGWWGAVPSGGKLENRVNWSNKFDQPLLVPPGTYDIHWQQNYSHNSEKVKDQVIVKKEALIEVKIQPPNVASPR